MSTCINDLYNGKIYPDEQVRAHSEEYHLTQEKLLETLMFSPTKEGPQP